MTDIQLQQKRRKENILIGIASVAIPVVVAALFGVKIDGVDLGFLPPIYASINGLTAVVLIAALIAVKNRNIDLHQKLVSTAFFLSILFLAGYVAYHITSETTYLGDVNGDKELTEAEILDVGRGVYWTYILLLIGHIVLSVILLPLALITYVRGKRGQVEKHRKMAKVTFPIWLFVAVSGVVVYLMISPYY